MVAPRFPRDIQPTVLGRRPAPKGLRLRGFHPLWRRIPADFGFTPRGYMVSTRRRKAAPRNSTSPSPFGKGFGLDSAAFGRPYSRHPVWFLFLPLLRCFTSGGSRSLSPEGLRERPLRGRSSHSGIPGSKAPCAYPGLFAAWHALLRRPSPAIHQVA